MILKFFGFFVGPIQFVMEVSFFLPRLSFRRCGVETKRTPHLPTWNSMLTPIDRLPLFVCSSPH